MCAFKPRTYRVGRELYCTSIQTSACISAQALKRDNCPGCTFCAVEFYVNFCGYVCAHCALFIYMCVVCVYVGCTDMCGVCMCVCIFICVVCGVCARSCPARLGLKRVV